LAKALEKILVTRGHTLAVVATTAFGYASSDLNRNALKAQSTMHRLLESAIREVELYLPQETRFYLPEFTEIAAAVGPVVWAQPWEQAKPNLRPDLVKHVFHTGQRLKTIVQEVELDESDLQQIVAEIDLLAGAIDEVVVDERSRQRLKQRLASLRKAVAEYNFWGIDRIQSEFDSTIGCTLPLVAKDEKGEVKQPWKHVLMKLAALSAIIGNFNSAYKNVHDFTLLLEAGARTVIVETAQALPNHSKDADLIR
jgi:hypothetical protein